MLNPVFKLFVEKSPISVMARGIMERVLNPGQLNGWFDDTAETQYTKDLLFSTLFDLNALPILSEKLVRFSKLPSTQSLELIENTMS